MGSYYKLVTMKVLVILGVLCRLVCSRYIVVDNAGQMTSQPMQMTSQPVHMTSPPVHMTSQPVHMTSPPVHITSPPMQMTSQPMHMTSQPMHMTSQPMHIPTIGGMQPISTSAYQPGFFGGTGSAVFQGSGASSSKVLEPQCLLVRAVLTSNLMIIPYLCRVLKVVDLLVLPRVTAKQLLWARELLLVLVMVWLKSWVQALVL